MRSCFPDAQPEGQSWGLGRVPLDSGPWSGQRMVKWLDIWPSCAVEDHGGKAGAWFVSKPREAIEDLKPPVSE